MMTCTRLAASVMAPQRSRQQRYDLRIRGLSEVDVVHAHRHEVARCVQTDDRIGIQAVEDVRSGDGNSDDDARCRSRPRNSTGRAHRRPRGDAVVDNDHGAPREPDRLTAGSEHRGAAADLVTLRLLTMGEIRLRDTGCPNEILIASDGVLFADGAEREFFVPWRPDLAHDEHVERRIELPRNLSGDGHASARKAYDGCTVRSHAPAEDRIVLAERGCELPPSVLPVREDAHTLGIRVVAAFVNPASRALRRPKLSC